MSKIGNGVLSTAAQAFRFGSYFEILDFSFRHSRSLSIEGSVNRIMIDGVVGYERLCEPM
jgi:hypothetical protein